MSDAPVMISIRNLKKSFGDLHVLKGIDLDVRRGEKVVVLGPSGSGKSTMLRCINALEDADSGTITVDGVEVTSRRTNINRLREHLGMVFQRFNLCRTRPCLKTSCSARWWSRAVQRQRPASGL